MVVSILILFAMILFWRWVSFNRKLQLETKKWTEEITSITIPLLQENIRELDKINARDTKLLNKFCGYNVNFSKPKRKHTRPRVTNRGK